MILSDSSIKEEIKNGQIFIDPFNENNLGPNSYDVHLSESLAIYKDDCIDCKIDNEIEHITMSKEHGYLLMPGRLYLGTTIEYTETGHRLMPNIDGKSSVGRLGIFIHVTAGRGDSGFAGFWTLEIVAVQKVRIYPWMPIGQLSYTRIEGRVNRPYDKKEGSKYLNKNPKPMPSKMFKNWIHDKNEWV